ncbi:helicase C-terminal domain-containing protein [Olsenella urininfantis]|uniref:helicase C-terminal domain-containing protein n=1 Tax=Olsenella urininfantis TaxID=1871033 RepID=UPI00098516CD|nr:helicase C-terminal domain-containing protein [Olsenella urininfantis]
MSPLTPERLAQLEEYIDALLPAHVSQDLRARYLSLPERAESSSFDLLEEDMVVIDTETTGLSFRDCELIEIAAARLSGREVVERFQTFVHPCRPIPAEISALTHISNLDVADAPAAEEAVCALADFVGGSPVLAHNAIFDRTFVEMVPGGRDVSDNWIDTLALSRIALPLLSSHRLADMAHAFGCDSVTHRATDDVDALAGMWRIILLGLCDLPDGLLAMLARMHEDIEWVYRPIFSHLAQTRPSGPFSLKLVRHGLSGAVVNTPREDAASRPSPATAPGPEELVRAFGPEGVVGAMYERFESRPEQLQMALEVRQALEDSTHRAIEAGTGVGKSVAYLLPELLLARQNKITVGVATKTNALTDQLISHELPALDRAIPGGVSFTSLKGYDHYLCPHRLDRFASQPLPVSQVEGAGRSRHTVATDMLGALAVSYALASQSLAAEPDTLGVRWRNVPRSMLTTTPAECLRGRCPYFPSECPVHGARRRAACSDVVVTNHSLLLRNIDMDGKILPPVRHWVVDEAHAFEAEARQQWAREVSGSLTREAFERLGGTKTGALHDALCAAGGDEASGLVVRLLTKASASCSRAATSMSDVFDALHELSSLSRQADGYESLTLWIDPKTRGSSPWESLEHVASPALLRLEEAEKDVKAAIVELGQAIPRQVTDLAESAQFLSELLGNLRLIMDGSDETYVYSAQLSRRRRDMPQEKLVAEKLDIGHDLCKKWLPEMESVIFTSATMAVGESFERFDHAVGLDRLPPGQHRDLQLQSSFDYLRNMSVVVAKDMPEPQDPRYLEALKTLLLDVHRCMGGSVLTLFTNRRDMELCCEALAPQLASLGIELVCQERGSSPKRLRERFMSKKSASLFALRSFWEGFDATGETLRCVVVCKLPFASPHDPIARERELREERAWWRYSLPDAVISLKQAAGRLIRSSSDSGVLVLADSRLVSKRYGRQFLKSLPNPQASLLESENVGRYLEIWRRGHEA